MAGFPLGEQVMVDCDCDCESERLILMDDELGLEIGIGAARRKTFFSDASGKAKKRVREGEGVIQDSECVSSTRACPEKSPNAESDLHLAAKH